MRNLLAIAFALPVAIVAAGAVWGWGRSPIPTFVLFTPLLHGMTLGIALSWMLNALGVQCVVRRSVIGLLAGIVSVIALAFAQYVSAAHDYHHQTQRAITVLALAPADAPRGILDDYDRHLLEPATGHAGVVGHLYLENRGAKARGWLRGVEALLVIGTATALCVATRATHVPPG